MKKYLIQYKMPLAGLDAWAAKPESERKGEETRLMGEWQKWTEEHKTSILEQFGAGKTKKVLQSGAQDFRNEIMLASVIQADDLESAGKMLEGHPHLQIPESWIEVTELRSM
jgi:hypothetical protein